MFDRLCDPILPKDLILPLPDLICHAQNSWENSLVVTILIIRKKDVRG